MSDVKTNEVKTLKERTTDMRVKARRLLRMDLINNTLQAIFEWNRNIEMGNQNIEKAQKYFKTKSYEIEKTLDENHPDFEQQKEDVKKAIEELTKNTTEQVESETKAVEEGKKVVANLEEKITKIESGEIKMNIEKICELAKELIYKS